MSRVVATVTATVLTLALAAAGASIAASIAHADTTDVQALSLTYTDDTSTHLADLQDSLSNNQIVQAGGGTVVYTWAWTNVYTTSATFSQALPIGMTWDTATINIPGCSMTGSISTGETLRCIVSGLTVGAGGSVERTAHVYSMPNNATINTALVSGSLSASAAPLRVQAELNLLYYGGDPVYFARNFQGATQNADGSVNFGHALSPDGKHAVGYYMSWHFALAVPRNSTDEVKGAESLSPGPITIRFSTSYSDAQLAGCGVGGNMWATQGGNGTPSNDPATVPNGGTTTCTPSNTADIAGGRTDIMSIYGTDSTYQRLATSQEGNDRFIFIGDYTVWVPASDFATSQPVTMSYSSFTVTAVGVNALTGTPDTKVIPGSSSTFTAAAYKNADFYAGQTGNSAFNGTQPRGAGGTESVAKWAGAPEAVRTLGASPGSIASGGTGDTGVSECLVWDPALWTLNGTPWFNPNNGAFVGQNPGAPSTLPMSDFTVEYGTNTYNDDTARRQPCGKVGDGSAGWSPSPPAAGGPPVTAVRIMYTKDWKYAWALPEIPLQATSSTSVPAQTHLNVFGSVWDDRVNWTSDSAYASTWAGLFTDVYYDRYSTASVSITNASTITTSPQFPTGAQPPAGSDIPASIAVNEVGYGSGGVVTLTLPNACFTIVGGSPDSTTALPSGVHEGDKTCSSSVGQTVTWNLTAFPAPGGAVSIPFTIHSNVGTPIANYSLAATVSSPADAGNVRTVTNSISISHNLSQMYVHVDTSPTNTVLHGNQLSYTLTWTNVTGQDFTATGANANAAHVVDVLPFNTDGGGTVGLSGDVALSGAVTTNPSSLVVEYTTDSRDTLSSALISDPSGNSGNINWKTTRPQSGVTALRVAVPSLPDKSSEQATFSVTLPSGFTSMGKIANSVNFVPDANTAHATGSNIAVVSSSTTTISGTVFNDLDYSSAKNTGDSPDVGARVTLSGFSFGQDGVRGTADDVAVSGVSTTTDQYGNYSFVVDPGSYSVAVSGVDSMTFVPVTGSPGLSSFDVSPNAAKVDSFLYQVTLPRPDATANAKTAKVSQGSTAAIAVDTTSGAPDQSTSAAGTLSSITQLSSTSNCNGSVGVSQSDPSKIVYLAPDASHWPSNLSAASICADTISYAVTNMQTLASSLATVTVTVYRTPTTVADSAYAKSGPGATTSVNVVINDLGDLLKVTSAALSGSTSVGSVTSDSTSVTYTPPTSYAWGPTQTSYLQQVTYVVQDSQGKTATGTLTLTVLRQPSALADPVTVSAVGNAQVSVLTNDLVYQPGLTIQLGTPSKPVDAHVDASNPLLVDVSPGFVTSGAFYIPYTITDAAGQSFSSEIDGTVQAVPTAMDYGTQLVPLPVQVSKNYVFTTSTNTSGTVPQVSVDTSVSGTTVGRVTTLVSGATVTVSGDSSTMTYNSKGYVGADSFTFIVTDSLGAKATARAYVKVDAAPTVNGFGSSLVPVLVAQGKSVVLTLSGLVAGTNESLPKGQTISTTNGSVVVAADGQSMTYTPNSSFHSTESFTIPVTDEAGGSVDVTAFVKVDPTPTVSGIGSQNSPTPVSVGGDTTFALAGLSPSGVGVLFTAGQSVTVTRGSVSFSDSTHLVYHPDSSKLGPVSFSYTVTDEVGATAMGTAYLTVDALPSVDDLWSAASPRLVALGSTASLAIHATGSVLSVPSVSVTQGSGSVSKDSGDSTGMTWIYSAGAAGDVTVEFTVTDEVGKTATGHAYLRVEPTISGVVYDDLDYSGSQDNDDTPISGATVTLSGHSFGPDGVEGGGDDQTVTGTVTTGQNGAYSFIEDPGSYSVAVSGLTGVTAVINPVSAFALSASSSKVLSFLYQDTLPAPSVSGSSVKVVQGSSVSVSVDTTSGAPAGGAHPSTIDLGPQPTRGTITKLGSTVTYTAASSWPGDVIGPSYTETFTYTLTNFQVLPSGTATVQVTVYRTAQAVPDTATVASTQSTSVDVLLNDEGDNLTVTSVSFPAGTNYGSVVPDPIAPNKVRYTPPTTYAWGSATSFSQVVNYTVQDSQLQTKSSTLTLTVVRAPRASDTSVTVSANKTPATVDVLTQATVYPQPTVTLGTVPSGVHAGVVDNKIQVYAMGPSVSTITVPYTITDGLLQQVVAQLVVTVLPIPTATGFGSGGSPIVVGGNQSIVLPLAQHLSDGASVSLSSATSANGGSVTVTDDGTSITYVPKTGYTGDDSFTFTAVDALSVSSSLATATLLVDPVPTAGSPTSETIVAGGKSTTITLPVSGSNLVVSIPVNQPSTLKATVSPSGTGLSVTVDATGVTPNSADHESFDYTVTDTKSGATANGTMLVQVDPVPTATDFGSVTRIPVTNAANGGSYTITLVAGTTMTGSNVSLDSASTPALGTLDISGNTMTYTPKPNKSGNDSFTYRVKDDAGAYAQATVRVTVLAALTAGADTISAPSNRAFILPVLGNDVGDGSLHIDAVTSPIASAGNPRLSLDGAGRSLTLTTDAIAHDTTVHFTYHDTDASGAMSDEVGVTVTVTATLATTDVSVDAPSSGQTPINVLDSDTGNDLHLTGASGPDEANVSTQGKNVLFTPAAHTWIDGETRYQVDLSYTVRDVWGDSLPGTAHVTVWRPPVVTNTTENIYLSNSATLHVPTAATVSSPGGIASVVTNGVQPATAGTVDADLDDIVFTSFASGPFSVGYTVTDHLGQSTSGTFTGVVAQPLSVVGVTAPIATSPLGITGIDVLQNDHGTDLSILSIGQPHHGTVTGTVNPVSYVPEPGYTGPDSFDYTVKDVVGTVRTGTVNLNVTLAPVTLDDAATTDLATPVTIDVVGNDTITTGTGTIDSVTQPSSGKTEITHNEVTFTPAAVGTFTFDYVVKDEADLTGTGHVTVTVTSSSQPTVTVTLSPDHTSFIVDGQGLPSGTDWSAEMHSTPIRLAAGTIGTAGTLHQVIALPKNPPAGSHSLVITGLPVNGGTTFTFYFVITPDGLAYTGADAAPWVLAGAALLGGGMLLLALVAWLRRKRNNAATRAV
ncbi:MAG: tandem-95 repeat protein [Actinomycetota bacterium]